MRTIVDGSPLSGETIDVAARVAWTLRMARLTAPAAVDSRLRTLAATLGTSPAHLSRVETGQRRDGHVADGYEEALGLPVGSLRSPIDILCRTFPAIAPRELGPVLPVEDVCAMSELTERVSALPEEAVTGGDWLAWAAGMSQAGNIGMPSEEFKRILRRLVGELGRAVTHAYACRYEALTRLRCSHYGDLVVEVAREVMSTPYYPGSYDLMSAVGERWTSDAVDMCLELVSSEIPRHLTAGSLGLENMGAIYGQPLWLSVADRLVDLFDASRPGSSREEWSAHLIRLVPPAVWRERRRRPGRPLPPRPETTAWEAGLEQELWYACESAATHVCESVGLNDQPMLARLMFDIAYCPWETRAVTSYMLLDALPGLRPFLWTAVHALFSATSEPGIRRRLVRRWSCSPYAYQAAVAGGWLDDDDPVVRLAGLHAAGAAGEVLPEEVLRDALDDRSTDLCAMYAMGMVGHPLLKELTAGDPAPIDSYPDHVQFGVRWWMETGADVPA